MPLSEFSLIYRYFSSLGHGPGIDLSVGDDCAIVDLPAHERLATSIDTLVEGVHFPADSFPEDIGYRAVAVAVSDLAAMGARPIAMTLALTLPTSDEFWLHTFSQGIAQAASQYSLPLIGGDTTRGPLAITVSVMGALPKNKALLRGGASAGDIICVSGTLGDAAAGLAFLQGEWQPSPDHAEFLLQRFNRPQARILLGSELLGVASAAIDISDGLLADVGHIADASGLRAVIDPARLPLSSALLSHPSKEQALQWALAGGDDYELCFTLSAAQPPQGCTAIGRMEAGSGVECPLAVDGQSGYRHFEGS